MEITIEEYLGDVMGDLKQEKRKSFRNGTQSIQRTSLTSRGTWSEILNIHRSESFNLQGRGEFSYEFVRYEELPENISKRIIEERNKINNKVQQTAPLIFYIKVRGAVLILWKISIIYFFSKKFLNSF